MGPDQVEGSGQSRAVGRIDARGEMSRDEGEKGEVCRRRFIVYRLSGRLADGPGED